MTAEAEQHTPAERRLHERRSDLRHRLRVSALYHQRRSRFFDICDKVSTAYAVLASTAAVSQLFSEYAVAGRPIEVALGASVALISTIALVAGYSNRARDHFALAGDYRKVLAQLEAAGDWPDVELIDKLFAEYTTIESREPAPMTTLVQACENHLNIADKGEVVPIPSYQRLLMQVWDFKPIVPQSKRSEDSLDPKN
jgi:hypothetical protein